MDSAVQDCDNISPPTGATPTLTVHFTVDKAYVKSPPGILRVCQILLNLQCLIMVAACVGYNGYPIFVCAASMVLSVFFFILYLIFPDKPVVFINRSAVDLVHNVWWAVMHFISACIMADFAAKFGAALPSGHYQDNYGCSAFAAVLGFALTALYLVSAAFSLDKLKTKRTVIPTTHVATQDSPQDSLHLQDLSQGTPQHLPQVAHQDAPQDSLQDLSQGTPQHLQQDAQQGPPPPYSPCPLGDRDLLQPHFHQPVRM